MTNSTWKLGDKLVHRLGFGAMRLALGPNGAERDPEQGIAVLRRAVELGVDHIDTAAFYFHGAVAANDLIKRALAPYSDDLVIATKVGPSRNAAGEHQPEARPDQLRAQVEQNLRELGRDELDLVYLRIGNALDRGSGSLAERFGVLADLRERGLIRHLGISNVGPEHLAEATAIAPVTAVQNWYGLSKRDDDALLDTCAEAGIAFVPFFSVQDGAPDGAVAAVAAAHGVTEAQVLLAWTLHRSPNVLAIPGTGSVTHLAENVAAGSLELTSEELGRLNSATNA
ncbi:oxidoreductase [Amycolatopsis sp. 195334CR]|uniref:oxidoreductase n=1 Tax=Amycolatopsis sp. 195334CR TaxID=2814588 RepID=UPI001F5C17E3|nr:oxidoreductase [Amycolatopsis sp. 195334CR]